MPLANAVKTDKALGEYLPVLYSLRRPWRDTGRLGKHAPRHTARRHTAGVENGYDGSQVTATEAIQHIATTAGSADYFADVRRRSP